MKIREENVILNAIALVGEYESKEHLHALYYTVNIFYVLCALQMASVISDPAVPERSAPTLPRDPSASFGSLLCPSPPPSAPRTLQVSETPQMKHGKGGLSIVTHPN